MILSSARIVSEAGPPARLATQERYSTKTHASEAVQLGLFCLDSHAWIAIRTVLPARIQTHFALAARQTESSIKMIVWIPVLRDSSTKAESALRVVLAVIPVSQLQTVYPATLQLSLTRVNVAYRAHLGRSMILAPEFVAILLAKHALDKVLTSVHPVTA